MADLLLNTHRLSWTDFKALVSLKSLRIQYQESADQYWIFAVEDGLIYWTEIWKAGATLPTGVDAGTNTSNRTDFETNYKPTANAAVLAKSVLYDLSGNQLLGQKAMAGSVPVVVASNQAAMAVTFTPPNARTGVSSATISLGGSTSGSLQVMRATTYTEPAAAAQRSLASSSANDAAVGTGARTVKIRYFDGTGDGPFEETVTLNGTTPVNTVATNIRFIEEMEVLTVGSNGSNVGTISLYGSTAGGGGVVGSIGLDNYVAGTGDNRTLWAHHYVPIGWEVELAVLVASIQSGGSRTVGKFFLKHAHPLTANSAEVVTGGVLLLQGMFERTYQFHIKLEGFVRVTAYGVPGVNNATLQCSFDWSELPV